MGLDQQFAWDVVDALTERLNEIYESAARRRDFHPAHRRKWTPFKSMLAFLALAVAPVLRAV